MMLTTLMCFAFAITPAISAHSEGISSSQCEIRTSCSQNITFKEANCHCDEQCVIYRDCCPDFISANEPVSLVPIDAVSCVSGQRRHGMISGTEMGDRIYLATRCPDNFNDDAVRHQCEADLDDPFLSVPVTDPETGILYKNCFCAVCHRIEPVLFWKVTSNCRKWISPNVNLTVNSLQGLLNSAEYGCQRYFNRPSENVTIRRCKHSTEHCPPDWEGPRSVKDLCSNHTNYVYHGSSVYRNKYCALCHGVEDAQLSCSPPASLSFMGFRPMFVPRTPSFSVMMDLNSGTVGLSRRSFRTEERLVMRRCPPGSVYDPFIGRCRRLACPFGQNVAPDGNQCVWAKKESKPSGMVDRRDAHRAMRPPGMAAPPQTTARRYNLTDCTTIGYNTSEYVIWENGTVSAYDEEYSPGEYAIDNGVLYVCSWRSMESNYTVKMNVTVEETLLNYGDIDSVLTVVGLTISLCCLAVSIGVHAAFPALRKTAGKCILGISVSLFVGQLLFLTASSVDHYGVCYAFAVCLHYAFLASFCWSNCLSVDIWLAFSAGRVIAGQQGNRRFGKYCLYASGLPTFLVLLSVVLDFSPAISDSYRPHYGERYCLINRSGALLVTFALPLACILAVNLVLFAITTRNIYLSKKVAKLAAPKTRNARIWDFVLYTKLYVIMGLTWLTGFLAVIVDKRPLWWIFIVFNTLQGAFLCFAFVFTKKTMGIFKERRDSRSTRISRLASETTPGRSVSELKSTRSTSA